MKKPCSAGHALLWTIAKVHAVYQAQKTFTIFSARYASGILFCCIDHLLESRVVVRMGIESTVIFSRLTAFLLSQLRVEQFLVLKYGDNLDHRLRIIARTG